MMYLQGMCDHHVSHVTSCDTYLSHMTVTWYPSESHDICVTSIWVTWHLCDTHLSHMTFMWSSNRNQILLQNLKPFMSGTRRAWYIKGFHEQIISFTKLYLYLFILTDTNLMSATSPEFPVWIKIQTLDLCHQHCQWLNNIIYDIDIVKCELIITN